MGRVGSGIVLPVLEYTASAPLPTKATRRTGKRLAERMAEHLTWLGFTRTLKRSMKRFCIHRPVCTVARFPKSYGCGLALCSDRTRAPQALARSNEVNA